MSAVHGICSHFHYHFLGAEKLAMPWLGCGCDSCQQKNFTSCANTACIGGVEEISMTWDRVGIGADTMYHKTLVEEMHTLIQPGDIVAICSCVDAIPQRKYWLGEVKDKGFALAKGMHHFILEMVRLHAHDC